MSIFFNLRFFKIKKYGSTGPTALIVMGHIMKSLRMTRANHISEGLQVCKGSTSCVNCGLSSYHLLCENSQGSGETAMILFKIQLPKLIFSLKNVTFALFMF